MLAAYYALSISLGVLMAIQTKLSKNDFEEILSGYGIGKYISSKPMDALENTVYKVKTDKGNYILKVYEFFYPSGNEDRIMYSINLCVYLQDRDIPVARIMADKKGKHINHFNGKPVVIQEFVDGYHPEDFNSEMTIELAKVISRMHMILLDSNIELKDFGWSLWNADFSSVQKSNNEQMKSEYKRIKEDFSRLDFSRLMKIPMHADIAGINLIYKGNDVEAIIDWDDAHSDFLISDLGVTVGQSFSKIEKIEKDNIKLFFSEYQKKIKLNEEEKKAMYYLIKMRLLSFYFWPLDMAEHHEDIREKLEKDAQDGIRMYDRFSKISLEEFLSLF